MENLACPIRALKLRDQQYPPLLKQLQAPPSALYYRGSLEIFSKPCLAVVGTRKPTPYGIQATTRLISELAGAGVGIISGLALGIDALAHGLTLEQGGLTAAVLGSGLDSIYPSANRHLACDIIKKGGCLISEFEAGVPAFRTNFPRRNRIISGLAMGTLVIEASERSGSLITARHAIHDNKEVLAVPGSIFSPASGGTNELIKLGAHVVTTVEDVLSVLKIDQLPFSKPSAELPQLDQDEANIMEQLSHEPRHIDQIASGSRLDMRTINSRLTIMEMNGLVKNTGNLHYISLI